MTEVANKYPANFHPEIIAIREASAKRKKSRDQLKGDIDKLNKSKFLF